MISWDFYARRTGNTLEKFLSDVGTYDEALQKFDKRGIGPAEYSDIMRIFASRMAKNFDIAKAASSTDLKNTTTAKAIPRQPEPVRKKRRKKTTNNKTSESKSNDKEYFRKVLPEKK